MDLKNTMLVIVERVKNLSRGLSLDYDGFEVLGFALIRDLQLRELQSLACASDELLKKLIKDSKAYRESVNSDSSGDPGPVSTRSLDLAAQLGDYLNKVLQDDTGGGDSIFVGLNTILGREWGGATVTRMEEDDSEPIAGLSFKKDANFGEWYPEVVVHGEMIEYYDKPGCYVMRPWAVSIWEIIKEFFDAEIKKMKVKNCYFPLFVCASDLQKEKNHMEGFAHEVAWVTKSGESELKLPIVMYPYFSKWIRGHRDLPLRLNQWCNVVRWESSNPTPFIRSCEFLWQEGHSVFATKEEADTEVLDILELYRRLYEELLAVPIIKGKKSERGKFAGGLYTTTVEAFVPNAGRGVQGATSKCLGQNFAKMFEINFENEKGENVTVWQNSWAFTTRTLGVMVMVHGDDKGLVLPPKVASLQAIVIPTVSKQDDTDAGVVIFDACATTVKLLNEAGIRADADLRENYSHGWKKSNWEMKGVPLRIEIGPKDVANNQVHAVRRDTLAEIDIPVADFAEKVKEMLDCIQQNLFDVGKQKRDSCIQVVHSWEEFDKAFDEKKMIFAPCCDEEVVEKDVITRTKGAAKSLCSPLDQPPLTEGTLCFASGKPAKQWTYWGRSY